MTARKNTKAPAWEAGEMVRILSHDGMQSVYITGTIANATRATDAKNPRVLVAFTPDDRRWYPVERVRRL